MFRLPLRTSSSTSRLSKKTHAPEKVLKELIDFFEETPRCVVFLKHVETIRIMKWNEGNSQPTVLYETRVKNVSSKLRQLRSAVVNAPLRSVPTTFDFELLVEMSNKSSNTEEILRYVVANQLGGNTATKIAKTYKDMHLIPFGGAALCVSKSKFGSLNGNAFVFLSIPTNTGLGSVGVNGYFELSSNRRDVWSDSDDLAGDGAVRGVRA